MIRKNIKSASKNIFLEISSDYIGRDVEVIAFVLKVISKAEKWEEYPVPLFYK